MQGKKKGSYFNEQSTQAMRKRRKMNCRRWSQQQEVRAKVRKSS